MAEPHYCSLAGCVCVACAISDSGCDDCELLHPELFDEVSGDG